MTAPETKKGAKVKKILILDDDSSIRYLIKSVLSDFIIYEAGNCNDFWLELKKVTPDLILLDIDLPSDDGFSIARQLSEEEEWRNIPIIFVTGRSDGDSISEGFDAGGYDYIKKPLMILN